MQRLTLSHTVLLAIIRLEEPYDIEHLCPSINAAPSEWILPTMLDTQRRVARRPGWSARVRRGSIRLMEIETLVNTAQPGIPGMRNTDYSCAVCTLFSQSRHIRECINRGDHETFRFADTPTRNCLTETGLFADWCHKHS